MHIAWTQETSQNETEKAWWRGQSNHEELQVEVSVFPSGNTAIDVFIQNSPVRHMQVWLKDDAASMFRGEQPLSPMAIKLIEKVIKAARGVNSLAEVMTTDAFDPKIAADPYSPLSEQNKAMAEGIIASYNKADK